MKLEFGNDLTNTILRQSQIVQTRMAGRAVIRVVERCENAQESNQLDLSKCQLCQVPDAVYHLMRNTQLTSCDLSDNSISKIPMKFSVKFPLITELNISHNKISKLPDELVDCVELNTLDFSFNSFVEFPKVVLKLPKIKKISANNNYIMDADNYSLPKDSPLEEVDLRENPLTSFAHNLLSQVTEVRIILSPREKEEWED